MSLSSCCTIRCVMTVNVKRLCTFSHSVMIDERYYIPVACFVFQFGVALGFLLPPLLVQDTGDLYAISAGLSRMFYATAISSTLVFILIYYCKFKKYWWHLHRLNLPFFFFTFFRYFLNMSWFIILLTDVDSVNIYKLNNNMMFFFSQWGLNNREKYIFYLFYQRSYNA